MPKNEIPKTPQQLQEEKLRAFLKKCVTRSDAKYKIRVLQRDVNGFVSTMVGDVVTPEGNTVPMVWNSQGKGLTGTIQFDLVTNEDL